MPVSNHLRRLLIETIRDNINEVTLGFDGTPATSDDGAAGRPAITLTPEVTIIDETSVLVEATVPFDESFTESLREVYVQMRNTNDFLPVGRFNIVPYTKNGSKETKIQTIIEVE